ncbi:MAG TPA: oligosaccharide flippase family protein [Polyangiaceae bacterium]|nr:oligosaccharide flippase family protein [Polyangiaceae bacterium]
MSTTTGSGVLKNTLMLVGAQLAGVPLTVLLSAALGRYLGADDFGFIYLASTLTSFGFLLVEWGHGSVLAAAIARDHSKAGSLFGSSVVWRVLTTIFVCIALALIAWLLGYSRHFQLVLLLVAVQSFLNTLRLACQDTVRGYERTDVSAFAQVGSQFLAVLLVIPTLLLGGQLMAVLVAQAAAGLIVSLLVWRAMRRIIAQPVHFDGATLKGLFKDGSSFMVFGLVLVLQPNVDAVFMSKLSPSEVLGWQAAAQRLMGLLMMPAMALLSALYPTLARLFAENMDEYRSTAGRALQATTILAIPMALSCALYRQVGAQVFGEKSFEPVEQNLLVLSLLVFLLYFSMPLSVAILAAGRQRPFAIAQAMCIVVSLVLDPLLIPWFQTRYGNGGLGVCVAGVVSEITVILAALWLVPPGILNRAMAKVLLKGALSGGAMVAVAYALGGITPYAAAPVALATYVGCLWLIGGIDKEQVAAIRQAISKKLAKRKEA